MNDQTKELVNWLLAKASEGLPEPPAESVARARARLGSMGLTALFGLFFRVEYGDRGDAVPEYTEACQLLYPELELVIPNAA